MKRKNAKRMKRKNRSEANELKRNKFAGLHLRVALHCVKGPLSQKDVNPVDLLFFTGAENPPGILLGYLKADTKNATL